MVSELSLRDRYGCSCPSRSPCLTSVVFLPGSCTGCAATFSVLKKRVSLRLLPQLAVCAWGRGVALTWQQMTSTKCWVLSHA